ncbi:MAG: hypothetical protein IIU63_08205, partial [Clostridia bacterium]|nr:hypothetical protein [Clostridia bacterium]
MNARAASHRFGNGNDGVSKLDLLYGVKANRIRDLSNGEKELWFDDNDKLNRKEIETKIKEFGEIVDEEEIES